MYKFDLTAYYLIITGVMKYVNLLRLRLLILLFFQPLLIYSRNLNFSPLDPITLTFDYDDDALSDDEVEMYSHPL